MSERMITKVWMPAILLLAASLRLIGIYNLSPPGLSHDEVANWLIDQQILAGQHGVYFTDAYGHEAGFHYIQTAFIALLGDHALALRLPTAFAGILLIAIHYTLIRQLFNPHLALLSSALLATVFWGVFFSRQGLRAMTLPVTSGLSAIYWWQGWQGKKKTTQAWALAGLWAGLSLYTYMAGRVVPIFYVLFIAYLFLYHRDQLKKHKVALLVFAGIFLLVAAPLTLFLWQTPTADYRIGEIDAPLRALLAGDFKPVWHNVWQIAGMFLWTGDPLWRQNIAGQPVFDLVIGVLFYGGFLQAIWQVRDARYVFFILWLVTGTIPSLVTVDAPSSIRIINSLLVFTLFPTLLLYNWNYAHLSPETTGLSTTPIQPTPKSAPHRKWTRRFSAWVTQKQRLLHSYTELSPNYPQLSPVIGDKFLSNTFWLVLIVVTIGHTFRTQYMVDSWATNEEVQFVWQAALTEAASFLNEQDGIASAAIAGWTPATMDSPTMRLGLQAPFPRLLHFSPPHTLLLPATSTPFYVITPTAFPLHPTLQAKIQQWGGVETIGQHTARFFFSQLPIPHPQYPHNNQFAEQLRFLGYDLITTTPDRQLLTYWQVLSPTSEPRRLFIHALAEDGTIVAQDDGLDAPPTYWQVGDLIVQHHQLPAFPHTTLQLGVYNPNTGQRLLLDSQKDTISLIAHLE